MYPIKNEAVTSFFEGLPAGQPVPWRWWIIPLFWWSTFYIAMFLVGASIIVILRKQWVDHERLSFPLAKVGDQMGGVGKGVYIVIAFTLVLTFLTAVVYTLHLGYS